MTRDIPVAQRLVDKLAKLLGISADKAGFPSVPPSDSDARRGREGLAADRRGSTCATPTGSSRCSGSAASSPSMATTCCPTSRSTRCKKGAGAEIDLLIGTNAEEMNLYLVPTGVRDKVGRIAVAGSCCADRSPRRGRS